jgi:hypothetical protein
MSNPVQSIQSRIATFRADGIRRLIDTIPSDEFQIVVNGEETSVSLFEAILVSPHIASELQHDITMRRYEIEDERIKLGSLSTFLLVFLGQSI